MLFSDGFARICGCTTISLNPCCNGCCSQTGILPVVNVRHDIVSILVVMDAVLRLNRDPTDEERRYIVSILVVMDAVLRLCVKVI